MNLLTLKPLYMQRVWGGRKLENIYNRQLPDQLPYGESWEISDREEEQSVISGGKYDGITLHQLWSSHKEEVFGKGLPESKRFPLLVKILDATKDLSIQVHPPREKTKEFGGDAKNEFWYVADSDPGSKLYIGLKEGVTKEQFERATKDGTVQDYVHAIEAKSEDSIYIPSGRMHAIGAGYVIYEIQQNSDTTFRVFDWNRPGLDGNPRELHIKESLSCINFQDFEPSVKSLKSGELCACEDFIINKRSLSKGEQITPVNTDNFAIWIIIKGSLSSQNGDSYKAADFLIAPVNTEAHTVTDDLFILEVTIPTLKQT